jgi:DNA-binding transcriptional LysR family regulator
MCKAALVGLGVAMIAKPDARPHLEAGELMRIVPQWYADAGPISNYYSSKTLLPSKTRVFIDFIVAAAQREKWPERFAGSLG